MTIAQQPEQPRNLPESQLDSHIADQLVHQLGRPAQLHTVQVRRLWQDYYRVNILVGADVASAKVAHSYFLKVDGDGNIIESTPKIERPQSVKLPGV
jgi:hypothetical protein